MHATHRSANDHHDPGVYEIRVKGHLAERWADRFEGLSLTHDSDGTTTLSGLIADQAALYGLLRQVRDLGMRLLSVIEVETEQAEGPDATP